MGKRSRAVTEDYESIANKIKKLEQKLMRTRRKSRRRTSRRLSSTSSSSSDRSSSSSSSSDSRSRSSSPQGHADRGVPIPSQPETLCIEGVPPTTSATASTVTDGKNRRATSAPVPSTSTATVTVLPSDCAAFSPGAEAPAVGELRQLSDPTPPLDEELLLILGDDPSKNKSYGNQIQQDLAIRLQHITNCGLSKDLRKDIVDKYLTPENCTLIEAPTLNPEVVAAIPEAVLKRDKSIEIRQKQRTAAISGIAEVISTLMLSEPRNTTVIQKLTDVIRLECDSQNADSIVRRNFILNTLKKEFKDQLQATKIDRLLFSEVLAETLKAAKAISKSGADLKSAPIKPHPPAKNKLPQKHLNWRGPPQNYSRLKGTQRPREPAFKDRPAGSSRPSSRPAQSRGRNRR